MNRSAHFTLRSRKVLGEGGFLQKHKNVRSWRAGKSISLINATVLITFMPQILSSSRNSSFVCTACEIRPYLSQNCLITNWSLPGMRVTDAATRPRLTSASGCSPLSAAPFSSASRLSRNDKSPSQPVLIGGLRALDKGREGGDWLCFTENIITPLNAGGPTEFPRPRNGDDHPAWEYMTWLSEALSPIWKPNCEA